MTPVGSERPPSQEEREAMEAAIGKPPTFNSGSARYDYEQRAAIFRAGISFAKSRLEAAQRAGGPSSPEIFGLEIPLLQAMVEYKHLMLFDRLIDRGFVKEWPSGYEITAEGRAALDAARQPDRKDDDGR